MNFNSLSALSLFSTSEFLRVKQAFSFGLTLLGPLGFSRKLKDKEKKSLRAIIFASGKPALLTRPAESNMY